MGDVIGVLLGAMRQDQIDVAEGIIELLGSSEIHLLIGNPINVPAGSNITRYLYPIQGIRASPHNALGLHHLENEQSLVCTHGSPVASYIAMIRKCNVLIGTPAGVEAARAYKPLATYWTVPK
jgi:hypothetical protein